MRLYHFTLYVVIVSGSANAAYINSDIYGDYFNFEDNITIAPEILFSAKNINIIQSVYLNNHGIISSDISIGSGCDVYIRNNGTINGDINLEPDAVVTQVIQNSNDIKELTINGPYNILVYRGTDITWSDISNIASNADKITLADSKIQISHNFLPKLKSVPPLIELIGENEININMADIVPDVPVLSNISGDGAVNINAQNLDILYAVTGFIENGNLYVRTVRETDYYKILGSPTGRFLNTVRRNNANENLIRMLDQAQNITELNAIMRRSMRLHPRKFNNALRTFDNHIQYSLSNTDAGLPVSVSPLLITGNDISVYGTGLSLNLSVSDVTSISASGYVGGIKLTDGIDDYAGILYGTMATFRHNSKNIFVQTQAGATMGRLNTPSLFDNDIILSNPSAASVYVNMDVGPNLYIGGAVAVTPTIGVGADYAKVVTHDTHITGRGGVAIEYANRTADITYKYGIQISAHTNSLLGAALKLDIVTPYDDATYSLAVRGLRDDMGTSYGLAANISLGF